MPFGALTTKTKLLLNFITVSKKFYRREQQSPFGHTIWQCLVLHNLKKAFQGPARLPVLPCKKKAKVELPSWHGLCPCYCCHCSNALWFQMAKTRQKIFSLDVVSRIFKKVSAVVHDCRVRWLHSHHIQNLSNCCRNKYNQSISWIFVMWFLAGFCYLALLCVARQASILAWRSASKSSLHSMLE